MQINQTSSQAILNWKSFNINAQESVVFQQPVGGIALNRISPLQGPSQILGVLSATGKIILINQAGIFFGPSARVDVGSIIASTADISDANFLAGHYRFDQASPYNASIINQGTIKTADYGLAALMGTGVVNSGVIEAHLGNVVLGAGSQFTLDLNGDKLINFSIDKAANVAGNDQNGKPLKNGVENSGALIADGGTIFVSAKTAENVVDNAVNISGVAQARSVNQQNGEIILSGDTGSVNVSGTLDVSGRTPHSKGGTVKVLAKKVRLQSSAIIDASGDAGGGTIIVGGDLHGTGPDSNADYTTVESGAQLRADALTSGDGGTVVVWSNLNTQFNGTISAKGGFLSGNGGFVETSGKYLNVQGANVDLTAPQGAIGTWLLDPTDLFICTLCTTTANFSGNTYSNNVNNSTLLVTDLVNALNSANITVETSAAGSGGTGVIVVNTPLTWSSATTLTLSAYRDVVINSPITNTGGGSLVLRANNAGAFAVGSSAGFVFNSSTLNFSGGGNIQVYYNPFNYVAPTTYTNTGTDPVTAYMLVNNVNDLQNINTNLNGNYALNGNIDASATSGWNSGAGFVPIGTLATPYNGIFNGDDFQISHLFINLPSTNEVGLFGATSASASITQLSVTGTIMGQNNVGGLVGHNAGTINNSYSDVSVTTGGGSNSGGGLVGNNSGTITATYSIGSVLPVTGDVNVGGLVGINTGIVNNSYWDTQASGQNSSAAGTARTTTQLITALPFGFSSSLWGIIANTSYPYLLGGNPIIPPANPVPTTHASSNNPPLILSINNIINSLQNNAQGPSSNIEYNVANRPLSNDIIDALITRELYLDTLIQVNEEFSLASCPR